MLHFIREKSDTSKFQNTKKTEENKETEETEEERVNKRFNYDLYFYPEIKNLIDEQESKMIEEEIELHTKSDFENFDKNRKIGENHSYICQIIRNDLISDFISYVNRTNISLSSTIKTSLFETNILLIENEPTLIEYAVFFGSIQIFQYLKINKAEITNSLWLYAIHSNKAEMIELLEDYQIEPPFNKYEKCLKESIKCHHNDIATYIIDILINDNEKYYNVDNNYNDNLFSYCFEFFNFGLLPELTNHEFLFFYACQYGYYNLVNLYLKHGNIDINFAIIRISNPILF